MMKKLLSFAVIVCFFLTSLSPIPSAHAESLNLPAPGTLINLSPSYQPVIIKGLTVHKDNPFLFDFIVDVGQDRMSGEPLKKEGEKLIKYFLASLAIPDKDLWVNLSPYEKDRMVPEALGQTDMGRDLLEQDYILKQMTASLIDPEKQLGKTFWDTVYAKAQEKYGTTQVPVNTFNKVWIMADRAQVFEHNQTAFVVDQHLKVMLEEDYLALRKHSSSVIASEAKQSHTLSSQIIKSIILPELEKEVNTGRNFANLRQIFNSIILSSWYKKNLQQALLNQVYADKSKIKGINLNDPAVKQQIYTQYLEAYKKGVFNYIKEDVNAAGVKIPRKYFSGGILGEGAAANPAMTTDPAMLDRSLQNSEGLVDFATLASTQPINFADKATITVDAKLKSDFPILFEPKNINGRNLDPEQVIEALAQTAGHDIPVALNERRETLESPEPALQKYAFPKFGDTFKDAQGNVKTFRQIVQGMIDNFLGINSPDAWRLNDEVPVPNDIFPLSRPGLQVTGPSNPLNMAINQLNAILSARMPDLEDASAAWFVPVGAPNSQTVGAFAGIENERALLSGEWEGKPYEAPNGKDYQLTQPKEQRPTTIERLPSIHLLDKHILINGKPTPALDVALALHFLSTYGALKQNGSGNYYYVPKIQTPAEALIVEEKLMKLEELTGLPLGTIKIEALYEEGNAGRWLPVIMWIWRHRLIGTNVGRWDYIGSLIEMWKDEGVFPDPQGIGMNSPNLIAYQRYNALLNVMVGVKNSVQTNGAPIGGMAAVMLYPKTDSYKRYENNPRALRMMKLLDKLRERLLGLIFVPDQPLAQGQAQPALEDILTGKVQGRLYDAYRQSWVATVDADYVAAGNGPLRADIKELQALLDAPEEYTEIDGKRIAPSVGSGLTKGERDLFTTLKLLNSDGKILPWVISRDKFNKPADLFNPTLWLELYGIPKGEITIEHIQHAFYMAAQYGFQILNGNYAAAIDDYELGLRFMNDLATYRIFVGWLWTAFHHQATVTKDGWIKNPELVSNLGVIPNKNVIEIKAGTKLTPEIFDQVWNAHGEWTKAFFADLDAKGASSTFDRRWADVIMDVLKRQLLSGRYLQHSPRVLFVIAEATPDLRQQILDAIFDLTREDVVARVQDGSFSQQVLDARDYVFDYYPADAAMAPRSALTLNDFNQDMHQSVVDFVKMFGWNMANVQVLDNKNDKQRLFDEEVQAGNTSGRFIKLEDGNYWAQSHPNDVMRAPPRTFVSTNNPEDKGLHNNHKNEAELRGHVIGLMQADAKPSDTVYVLPYLRGPKGSPFSKVGVQITTDRQVALQIMTLYNVGRDAIDQLQGSSYFTKGVNVPGDLDEIWSIIGKGGEDGRHFAAFLNKREFLSRGSAYGGNAILPKKFELRQGMWDSVEAILKEGRVILSEHMFILQITEKATGRKFHILGAFPSQSGKTNMGMIELPAELKDDYTAQLISDDLSDIYQAQDPTVYTPEELGHLFAHNPEDGVFGVIYGTGVQSNSALMKSLKPNSNIIYTNVAVNRKLDTVWWEKKTDSFPAYGSPYYDEWEDWEGNKISERVITQEDVDKKYGVGKKQIADLTPEEKWDLQAAKGVWAHLNSRASVPMSSIVNLSPDFYNPKGVKIDAIMWGGKTDHHPLLYIPYGSLEGINDGFSAVAKTTAAQEGAQGVLEADLNAQRPFFGPPPARYQAAWLKVLQIVGDKMPVIAHINQIQPDWPGYDKNGHVLKLLIQFIKGDTSNFQRRALGYVPREAAFDLQHFVNPRTKAPLTGPQLEAVRGYDPYYWYYNEMPRRDAYYDQLDAASSQDKVPVVLRETNAAIKHRLKNEITAIELDQIHEAMYNNPNIQKHNGELSVVLLEITGHPVLDTTLAALNEMLRTAGVQDHVKLKTEFVQGPVSKDDKYKLVIYQQGKDTRELQHSFAYLASFHATVERQVLLRSTGELGADDVFTPEQRDIARIIDEGWSVNGKIVRGIFTSVLQHKERLADFLGISQSDRKEGSNSTFNTVWKSWLNEREKAQSQNRKVDMTILFDFVNEFVVLKHGRDAAMLDTQEIKFDIVRLLTGENDYIYGTMSAIVLIRYALNRHTPIGTAQASIFREFGWIRPKGWVTDTAINAALEVVNDPQYQPLFLAANAAVNAAMVTANPRLKVGGNLTIRGTSEKVDRAATARDGGIDLSTSNGMQWKDSKDGQGVEINIDPALIARVRQQGIGWLSPVVLRMTTVRSVWPLMGLRAPMPDERLAKV